MRRPTFFALASAAYLFTSAASAQPSQPAPPSQSTQTAPSTQVRPSTPTALPAQPAMPPKQAHSYGDPCRTELESFCVSKQPQAIRLKCLDSHETEFSAACRNRRAELRELRASCQAVIEQSCRYVPPIADALLDCLQEHEAELAGPCRSLREKAQQPSHYIAAACQSDFKKFCKNVPLRGMRIAQCLREHDAELSQPCLAGASEK